MILRSSLCLLLTAALMSVASAAPQRGYTDVQSLQYEFGQGVAAPQPVTPPPDKRKPKPPVYPVERRCVCVPVPSVPVRCAPVSCVPVCMPVRCVPVCGVYHPYVAPCRPVVHRPVHRRAFVRPVPVPVRPVQSSCGCR